MGNVNINLRKGSPSNSQCCEKCYEVGGNNTLQWKNLYGKGELQKI
jgi:hypothetical protein